MCALPRIIDQLSRGLESPETTVTSAVSSLPSNVQLGQFSSVVMKGNTLNQLANNGIDYANWTITGAGTTKGASGLHLVEDAGLDAATLLLNLKNNTQYTVFYRVKAHNLSGSNKLMMSQQSAFYSITTPISNNVGWNKLLLTTLNPITYNQLRFVIDNNEAEGVYIDITDVMIFEGDQTANTGISQYISYGTKSTFSAGGKVVSVNGNLCPLTSKDDLGGFVRYTDYWIRPIALKPNTTYRMVANKIGNDVTGSVVGVWSSGNSYVERGTGSVTILSASGVITPQVFTTNNTPTWRIALYLDSALEPSKTILGNILKNYTFQLNEFSGKSPAYEPHQKSEAYIPPFDGKSLPNGTKDEFSIVDGVYTQSVSDDVALNGNLPWATYSYDNFTNTYAVQVDSGLTNYVASTITNIIGYCADGNVLGLNSPTADSRGVYLHSNGKYYLHIEKTRIDAQAGVDMLTKFKAYLNQYPITLNYQLATESVIPEQVMSPQVLTAYPNGTIIVSPVCKENPQIYNNGIFISNTNYPIKSVDKLWKLVDDEFVEQPLTGVSIAANKLSVTISGATNNVDRFILAYEYDQSLSTIPSLSFKVMQNIRALKDGISATCERQLDTINELKATRDSINEKYNNMAALGLVTEDMVDANDIILKNRINDIINVFK